MPKVPGLGKRLIACIKNKGYGDRGAKFGIAVTRFGMDYRYPPGFVYKWVSDLAVPTHETMLRLARDLDTTPGWLHYGEAPRAKAQRRPRRRREPGTRSTGGASSHEEPGALGADCEEEAR